MYSVPADSSMPRESWKGLDEINYSMCDGRI